MNRDGDGGGTAARVSSRRASSGPTGDMLAMDVEHERGHASAFMARQAERAHLTGLSPIEEMRIAQNELRARAAKQMVCAFCMEDVWVLV